MTTTARPAGPLVSCIMPTFNRRAWVQRAVKYFLRQDYATRELIVVDDGTDPVGDIVTIDPSIRYVRLKQRTSIGSKRNLACEHARGELLVHWDDDDWSAPWRLRYQTGQLLRSDADVLGLDSLLYWEPYDRRAWRYRYPRRQRPWVHDPTFCYRRELWERCPFPDISHNIDTQYLWYGVSKHVAALADVSFYVGVIHGANTSVKRTVGSCWQSFPISQVEALLGEDIWSYSNLSAKPHG